MSNIHTNPLAVCLALPAAYASVTHGLEPDRWHRDPTPNYMMFEKRPSSLDARSYCHDAQWATNGLRSTADTARTLRFGCGGFHPLEHG
jgi:hypothetical protein